MIEQKLSQAEKAIEDLADALGITEQEVVSILREGMEAKAPIANSNLAMWRIKEAKTFSL